MQPSLTNKRPRRWRRFFIAFAVLVLVVLVLFWLLPWLLMPEDLRRMQGAWTIVRVEVKADRSDPESDVVEEKFEGMETVTISGNRIFVGGDENWIELDPAQRRMHFFFPEDNQRRFLGVALKIPLWLTRPSTCGLFEYEVSDNRLFFGLRGGLDLATGKALKGNWRNVYLQRQ